MRKMICPLLFATVLAAAAPAIQAQAEPSEPDLAAMTCGDLELFAGDDSRTQDLTYLMIWAYGVRTGAAGADLARNPFTAEALTTFVNGLLTECEKDSDAKVLPLIVGRTEGVQ